MRSIIIAALTVVFTAGIAQAQTPDSSFRDCDDCPEMVVIPAGSFMMGADKNLEDASDFETPRHRVTIARPFAIGKYEVTQAEWMAVMGGNPSKFRGRLRPVEQVSWDDAQDFIRRLNAKTGKTYRLPTEAEWEYAARAGTTTAYSFGDDRSKLGQYAWFAGNSGKETHPVGQLQANRFGLYDMDGNVLEWVEDCWHDNYTGAPTDGSAWQGRSCLRVNRGGSWYYIPSVFRSANRYRDNSGTRGNDLGFRLARTLP
ncbi:formylglycine-generating enzyme family protein [Magnetospirillum sp. 15-1]|uniref:formylglycine-generating enzyme family protein n=1 Tax=Magnetospirillum sp. 15-1 TaxID=1979370 RepID=UPI000BBC1317|nr:formylglycine-generating enzyme family protein [Magnetospirillum sp. 15-1]